MSLERSHSQHRLSQQGEILIAQIDEAHEHEHHAPLHKFEEACKFPVDLGLFFFALCNAGVDLDVPGPMTFCVFGAIVVGKSCGITAFALFATTIGFPLPAGVGKVELMMLSLVASIGLTVALFVSGEAFGRGEQVSASLESQSKMGALLSAGIAGVAIVLGDALHLRERGPAAAAVAPAGGAAVGVSADEVERDLAQTLEQNLMEQLAMRKRLRKYQMRGLAIDVEITEVDSSVNA